MLRTRGHGSADAAYVITRDYRSSKLLPTSLLPPDEDDNNNNRASPADESIGQLLSLLMPQVRIYRICEYVNMLYVGGLYFCSVVVLFRYYWCIRKP